MYLDILKNPIIIGLVVGVITYVFMLMRNTKKYKKNQKSKEKNKPNILIPVIAAIVSGILVWLYFGSSETKPEMTMTVEKLVNEPLKESESSAKTGGSSDSVSYHLVGKGINFPHNLPDVFLDLDGFD